jgi:uncharacterized protein (DUF983 family)
VALSASLWRAIAAGKCPRCRDGGIFKGRMQVHDKCPKCGLLFDRESGYFLGAMYIEYGIASGMMAMATIFLRAVWRLRFQSALLFSVLLFLPVIPLTIRLSRTLWIYFDNAVDPQPKSNDL